MKEIQREPNLPPPTDCFGDEKPMATWYECPHCGKESPLTREWVGFTSAERDEIVPMLVQSLVNHDDKTMAVLLRAILIDVEDRLKEKNNG
jgi:hypothetical protein